MFFERAAEEFVAELVDVCGVVEWCVLLDAEEVSESVFDVVRVGHASDEHASFFEVGFDFLEDNIRIVEVFDDFCCDDDVVFCVECPFAVQIDDCGFDVEGFLGFCEHVAVDVKAGDGVSGGEIFGESPIAAADVKDVFACSNPMREEFSAFLF